MFKTVFRKHISFLNKVLNHAADMLHVLILPSVKSEQTVTHRLVCVFVSPAVWDGPAVGDRSESSVC